MIDTHDESASASDCSAQDTPRSAPMDIQTRVSISLSVGRYLRSDARCREALKEFTEASRSLRKQLGSEQRFVVQIDFKHYLVTSDSGGNFVVEAIESL